MRKNKLTKRQIDLIEDLFTTELEEKALLKKHNVSPRLYVKWQAEEAFAEYFEKRIVATHRLAAAMLARKAEKAANKLIKLTDSEKPETARKACLDIIATNKPDPEKPGKQPPNPTQQYPTINPKTAEKILAILAQEESTPDERG